MDKTELLEKKLHTSKHFTLRMETKKERKILTIRNLVALGEFILLNLCFLAVFLLLVKTPPAEAIKNLPRSYLVMINLAYAISLSHVGIVLDQRIVTIDKITGKVTKTCSLYALLILLISVFLVGTININMTFWSIYLCAFYICALCWRIVARIILKHYRSKGNNYRRVIILGAGTMAKELYETISANSFYGYKFLGFFDDRAEADYKVNPEMVKGKIDDVYLFSKENCIDEIFCALPAGDDRKALPIIQFAEKNMIRCFIVPDFKRFIKKKVALSFLGDVSDAIPIITLREEPLLEFQNKAFKRLFDIVVSFVFLITIFPILYIVLGSIIKLTSKGPVFFKQTRTGKDAEDFTCYKFRTMMVNKDSDTLQATKGDARVTKIGAFMRKTNLDEMPQFINVLKGNMSIVGPRPHMLQHTKIYSELINEYMVRHFAKPGITGWAQVTGFRGETKDLEDMVGRVKRDVWYIENWSFWLDLKIIVLTVYNMIKGEENAY